MSWKCLPTGEMCSEMAVGESGARESGQVRPDTHQGDTTDLAPLGFTADLNLFTKAYHRAYDFLDTHISTGLFSNLYLERVD